MSSISKNNTGPSAYPLANVVFPNSYPYTVAPNLPNNSFVVVDTTQSRTVNLPSTPAMGMSYRFKDGNGLSSSNPITIEGNGNTIDEETTYTIAFSWGFVGFIFNGTQWNVSNN